MPQMFERSRRTADGVRLAATVHHGDVPSTRAVVVVHGFSASRHEAEIAALVKSLADGSSTVVVYDSRGHGESGGQCTLGDSERLDVAAAVDHAAGFDVPVVVAGVSMGGLASIRYLTADPADTPTAARSSVVGLVTVSTPSRLHLKWSLLGIYVRLLTATRAGRALAAHHPGVRISPDLSTPADPASVVGDIASATAFVHGTDDPMISADDAAELHGLASEPRRLDLVSGMGHGLTESGREATRRACLWAIGEANSSGSAG
jgi:pimeloyl-ACP methyl ester carboxylesterase